MKCPVCTTENLLMTDRQGIEIDYCPKCRGVWLDRGELDKLIEKGGGPGAPRAAARDESYGDRRPDYDSDHGYRGGHRRKRREGFLADLFDFD